MSEPVVGLTFGTYRGTSLPHVPTIVLYSLLGSRELAADSGLAEAIKLELEQREAIMSGRGKRDRWTPVPLSQLTLEDEG